MKTRKKLVWTSEAARDAAVKSARFGRLHLADEPTPPEQLQVGQRYSVPDQLEKGNWWTVTRNISSLKQVWYRVHIRGDLEHSGHYTSLCQWYPVLDSDDPDGL